MNETSKLLLTVAIGGTLLGAGLSRHVPITMNHSAEADWRDRYRAAYADTSMQYADAGPFDPSPSLTWPGAPPGLQQAMIQEPLDYGPNYGAGYGAEPALLRDSGENAVPDPSESPPSPEPAVEEALQAATATAVTLRQTTTEQPTSAPATGTISRVGRTASPNGSASTGTNSDAEAANAL